MGEVLFVLVFVAVFLMIAQAYGEAGRAVTESLLYYGESPCESCSLAEECTEAFLCGL